MTLRGRLAWRMIYIPTVPRRHLQTLPVHRSRQRRSRRRRTSVLTHSFTSSAKWIN